MDGLDLIARRYLRLADLEAPGSSPSYEALEPRGARRPRPAASWRRSPRPNGNRTGVRRTALAGERPGDGESLRHGISTPGARSAARSCGAPRRPTARSLRRPAPAAASDRRPDRADRARAAAGLCLIPDRYSYAYSEGTAVHPPSGPSDLVLTDPRRCRPPSRPEAVAPYFDPLPSLESRIGGNSFQSGETNVISGLNLETAVGSTANCITY